MATKYDTNPLDPDFPEKARAAAAQGEIETRTLPYNGGETRLFPETAQTEEQTRKFASDDVSAYSSAYSPPYASPYTGQYVPAGYGAADLADVNRSSSRRVDKVGLPENVLTAVPYLPFTIGLVAGILELLFVPRSEAKVRFHAAQGLAAHIGILIVTTILGIVSRVTDVAAFGNGIFQVATSVMLIVFAIKAWKGKPVHIEAVDALTNWLDEKISPRN